MSRPIAAIFALLIAIVLPLHLVAADSPSRAGIGPVLQRALSQPDSYRQDEQGRLSVWVFFRDRGLEGEELAAALDRAEALLNERAARRRAKMVAPGERLVGENDLPVSPRYIERVLEAGGELRRTSRWLNAASFEADPATVERLVDLEFVRELKLVARFARPEIPTPFELPDRSAASGEKAAAWTLDYGLNLAAMEQVNVPPVHELGLTGAGVVVGMLDTGFHPTHESLAAIPVLASYDFVNDDGNVDYDDGDPSNSISHGTETMSTVMGYAPGELVAPAFGVSAVLAKTEDISQEVPIEEDQWVAGLEFVEAWGADIVSSSLGYTDWYTLEDLDGDTCVTTIAADEGAQRGLVVVNSAGNERSSSWGTLIAPADGDSVITIGAVSADSTVTYFSSPGPTADGRIKPDVCALGYGNRVANPYDDFAYVSASGTSFSCPLVAGVVALILERAPQLTPMEVREALTMTATQSDNPDNDYGWGIVDALAAVMYFGPKYVHTPLVVVADETGPYPISAEISDVVGVDPAQVSLHYRVEGGAWNTVAMAATGGDVYTGYIPGQPYVTGIEYYLEAVSVNGVTTTEPDATAAVGTHYFQVSPASGTEDPGAAALPKVTALGPAAPNPFNPRTEISFRLAESGPARLDVYDLKGTLVRTLVDGHLEAGPHVAPWNGRDSAGLEVGSGVYLYRLVTVDVQREGKMMLVR